AQEGPGPEAVPVHEEGRPPQGDLGDLRQFEQANRDVPVQPAERGRETPRREGRGSQEGVLSADDQGAARGEGQVIDSDQTRTARAIRRGRVVSGGLGNACGFGTVATCRCRISCWIGSILTPIRATLGMRISCRSPPAVRTLKSPLPKPRKMCRNQSSRN